ncbi:sulfatase [Myxococcota bacterium]|nr:sulfatase [Myxococcota bacterium]
MREACRTRVPPWRRSRIASFLALTAIAGLAATVWVRTRERSFDTSAVYHLALRDRDAQRIETGGAQRLATHSVELGFDRRFALYQHPPSSYRFADVPVSEGAVLRVAPLLAPEASRTSTDGAVFEIRCADPAGHDRQVFRMEAAKPDPGEPPRWDDRDVSLAGCSQPTTSLELRTACGPNRHCDGDWAFWGDPRILYRRTVSRRPLALVLLISVDTLRADRIEPYGSLRPTPHLQALARDGIVFETARSPSPWTIPSHASLLTSTSPLVHGATGQTTWSSDLSTLAERFSDQGWSSAAFVDSPWLVTSGFRRGFQHFHGTPPATPNLDRRGASITQEHLREWLASGSAQRVFVFWHIMDVHGPYGSSAPFAGRYRQDLAISSGSVQRLSTLRSLGVHDYLELDRFRSLEDLVAAYEEGVASVDAAIGDLLGFLKQAGWYDEALIVVTSDHGERLFERGIQVGHGLFLSEPDIAIPLLVKLPRNRHAGTRVEGLAELIDVAPTVLAIHGIPVPDSFEGRPLLDRDRRPAARPEGPIFGTSSNTGAMFARTTRYKYISPWRIPPRTVTERHLFPKTGAEAMLERIDPEERLFDLTADPGERDNLLRSEAGRRVASRIRNELAAEEARAERLRASHRAAAAESFDEETRARLRALGYLDAGSPPKAGDSTAP